MSRKLQRLLRFFAMWPQGCKSITIIVFHVPWTLSPLQLSSMHPIEKGQVCSTGLDLQESRESCLIGLICQSPGPVLPALLVFSQLLASQPWPHCHFYTHLYSTKYIQQLGSQEKIGGGADEYGPVSPQMKAMCTALAVVCH